MWPNKDIQHLLIALGAALLCGLGIAAAAPLVGVHTSDRVLLSLTPQAIGNHLGREELAIKVDAGEATMCCTWGEPNAACPTPGQDGFLYGAADGRVICKYASVPLYCSGDGTIISYDEARLQTATTTPTVTNTPANTATATPA